MSSHFEPILMASGLYNVYYFWILDFSCTLGKVKPHESNYNRLIYLGWYSIMGSILHPLGYMHTSPIAHMVPNRATVTHLQ